MAKFNFNNRLAASAMGNVAEILEKALVCDDIGAKRALVNSARGELIKALDRNDGDDVTEKAESVEDMHINKAINALTGVYLCMMLETEKDTAKTRNKHDDEKITLLKLAKHRLTLAIDTMDDMKRGNNAEK